MVKSFKLTPIGGDGSPIKELYIIGSPTLREARKEAADSSVKWAGIVRCILVTGPGGVHERFVNGHQD